LDVIHLAMILRNKLPVVLLALYWPAVFVLSHIPIPRVVREAHASDKSLHFLAYMVLTLLLWSVVKPGQKVRWRKAAAWWVLGIVMVYGVCDELLQHFVAGRSTDARDLVADAAGAVTALGVLSFLSFRPAFMVAVGTIIYTLTVFVRADVSQILPVTATVFHLAAYVLFTLLWAGCLRHWQALRKVGFGRFIALAAAPVGLMVVAKASAMLSGKAFTGWDMVAAGVGVLAGAGAVTAVEMAKRRRARNAECQ